MIREISVKFYKMGFHNWDGAPDHRDYLAARHRHVFHVTATIEVTHNDREVEFHDFQDFCIEHFPEGDLGGQSCEMLAEKLIEAIKQKYPNRSIRVEAWEDGEVGAILTYFSD